jgi:Ca2+-binding EF-hand superfamily protein
MTDSKQLSEKKVSEARKEFDYFDRDKNGQIELVEFIELLAVLSPKSKAKAAEEGFALIDTNDDGFIDFEEFLDWWTSCWWEY